MDMEKDTIYTFLDRHPESDGNETGDNRNDHTLGITERGVQQARAQTDFMMADFFPKIGVTSMKDVQIWTSPYTRVQQGLNEKLKRIYEINPDFIDLDQKIFVDDSLMERNFGKLPYIEHLINDTFKDDPLIQATLRADWEVSKEVYSGTPHSAKPEMGESHKEIGSYIRHFLDSLQRDIDQGHRFNWVMTHGDVIKQIKAKMLHQHETSMDTPNNCDVILISGTPRNMSVQTVYDGKSMKSCFDSPIERAQPKRIGDLPFAQKLVL
ncbi:MAG: histidine phosphatase family protein [Alphaproteobacteria bacterium]